MSAAPAESTALDILQALRRDLAPWCSENGARSVIAPDPAAVVDLITAGQPKGALIVLWYGGDNPIADAGLICDNQVSGRFGATVCVARSMAVSDIPTQPDGLRLAESLRTAICTDATGEGLMDGWRYGGMSSTPGYGGDLLPAWSISLEGVYAFRVSDSDADREDGESATNDSLE